MLKISLRYARHGMGSLARIIVLCAVAALLGAAGAVLAMRFWLLPHIENYHDQIDYAVSRAIGQPVNIGKIEADWHGIRPHLLLINVRILDAQGQDALTLEKVESEVSWTSLFVGGVRLYSLELDQPDLFIKRDSQGRIFIAGVQLSGTSSDGSTSPDWLLNQSRIEVRNARVTWQDDLRSAPSLVFDDVNLLIDNGWSSHRFAFRALPPSDLSSEIDVRGEFRGASFSDIKAWDGEVYTRLDYVDVAAWRTWFPFPVPISRGKGALRGWLDIVQGKLSHITADLALSDVRTRLASNLPVLDLSNLRGRVGWHAIDQGAEVFSNGLSLRLSNGFVLKPTDFYLRYAAVQGRPWASGEVSANKLDLQGLTLLSEYLPFGNDFKQQLAAFAPRGRISDLHAKWQAGTDGQSHYEINGRFNNLAMKQVGKLPGFSGLSGTVDGNENSGTLSLDSRKLAVDAPGVMREKLLFDLLTAQVGWERDRHGLEIKLNNVFVANADLSGNLYGNYHIVPGSPGVVDLTARLTRAEIKQVDRYIPVNVLGKDVHDWLRMGLVGGISDDVSLRLVGDLRDFPFPENKEGMFRIRAHIKDGAVAFLPDWPRIEDINGELVIEGRRIEVNASSATTAGNALQKINVAIPDLLDPDLVLQAYGEAAGATSGALDYIRKSPVRGYIGGFTDNAVAHGNGKLHLVLNIPLVGSKPLRVNGVYHFQGDDINLGGGIPVLRDTSGDLMFSESSVGSQGLAANILGGPATLEVKSSNGGRKIDVRASGKADMDTLRDVNSLPLLRYLHGGSPWNLRVTVQDKQYDALFASDMVGLSSNLPAPFAKEAGDSIALRFEQKSFGTDQERVSIKYGDLVDAELMRSQESGTWAIRRGTILFGKPERPMKTSSRDGIWLEGDIPWLSLEGWGPMLEMAGEGEGPGVSGADLVIRKLTGYAQSAENVWVNMHSSNGMLFAQLASPQINGDVIWQPQDKGALVVRLKNMEVSDIGPDAGAGKPVAIPEDENADSPGFHIYVDHISYKNKHLGKMELQAKRRAGTWLMENMELINPDGRLTADGKWLTAGGAAQTQVNFKLEIKDAGKTLTRYGYPNSVKEGGGKLEGSLFWNGAPDEFSYTALGGSLKLDVNKGQFLKIDPGAGKLLSILSLQALPRHITLDFTDVFSKGFVFSKISGTAKINQGVLNTGDLKVDGSAAKVTMSGLVDLDKETQNLRVVVVPEMGGDIATLGICALNPAVCVPTLIAGQILKNPVEKLTSYEYNITGTWADPVVTKVGSNKPATPPQDQTKPDLKK